MSRDAGAARQLAAGVALVAVAGAAGWFAAGEPRDGAGTVPPSCPASLPADPLVTGRPGAQDRLVPVPMPQPRGPVAARVCAYSSGTQGAVLQRSAVLDPVRTAALAGEMNSPDQDAAPTRISGAGSQLGCRTGGRIILLLFRYSQGLPFVAEVHPGDCAVVSTSARVEWGRKDIVRRVAEAIS